MGRHTKKVIESVTKGIEKIEHQRLHGKPFNIEKFQLKPQNISLSSCCRPEWGFTIDISTKEILMEKDAELLCEKLIEVWKLYQKTLSNLRSSENKNA